MCPAPLTIWPPQLRTTVPSCEMSPKWAFTAIIWFRYSALEASCAVVFFKENILPRGPQAAILLLDGLNNSFGRMETQQQWGLLQRGTGLQWREPRTICCFEIGQLHKSLLSLIPHFVLSWSQKEVPTLLLICVCPQPGISQGWWLVYISEPCWRQQNVPSTDLGEAAFACPAAIEEDCRENTKFI